VTQVLFQEATAGTYEAIAAANDSIIEFLTTANASANLANCAAYLLAEGVTFEARKEEKPIIADGVQGTFCYLTTHIDRMPQSSAAELHWRCKTKLTIWSSKGSGEDAANTAVAVSGAIASMLKQTIWDGSALDWKGFHSNAYPDENVNEVTADAPAFDVDSAGKQTGRVKVALTATWFHEEKT